MKPNFISNHDAQGSVFANLLTDYMFKRVYGNKDVLLSFLNMVLTDIEVADLEYQSTETLGNSPNERKAIYDLKCKSKDGEIFIVEMQLARLPLILLSSSHLSISSCSIRKTFLPENTFQSICSRRRQQEKS